MTEQYKLAVDAASAVTVVSTLAGYLPALAALFSIAWTAIRIWETKTVKGWRRRRAQPCRHNNAGYCSRLEKQTECKTTDHPCYEATE